MKPCWTSSCLNSLSFHFFPLDCFCYKNRLQWQHIDPFWMFGCSDKNLRIQYFGQYTLSLDNRQSILAGKSGRDWKPNPHARHRQSILAGNSGRDWKPNPHARHRQSILAGKSGRDWKPNPHARHWQSILAGNSGRDWKPNPHARLRSKMGFESGSTEVKTEQEITQLNWSPKILFSFHFTKRLGIENQQINYRFRTPKLLASY